ncbi:unnamed protein product [Caenorhabditis sp. 36 PRJEB53466]|nr:unnamed protein product [Caenorhabditis sp. 36 PRJEB53466]
MNETLSEEELEVIRFEDMLISFSAVLMTLLSAFALIFNTYLLLCAQYLRDPVSVNLRLCVLLSASDALCSLCYIFTYLINIFFSHFSNCTSLLLEVIKLSTFTSSILILGLLACNHYIGIVHPLHRNIVTPRALRMTVLLSCISPFTGYLSIFILFPGGLRAPIAFAFFDSDGCQGNAIYRNNFFRASIVGPFIVVIIVLSCLYFHIGVHMRRISLDPLLRNNNNKRNNRKLLITILLLAGSACAGWLPTTLNFLLPLAFNVPRRARLYLGILAQLLHVAKLLADAFIYAHRLIEIKYAMYVFNRKFRITICRLFRIRVDEKEQVPTAFTRYLSETKENRSVRSKRVKSEFQSLDKQRNAERAAANKNKKNNRASDGGNKLLVAQHQPLKACKSVPTVVMQDEVEPSGKSRSTNNSVIVKTVRLSNATSFNYY